MGMLIVIPYVLSLGVKNFEIDATLKELKPLSGDQKRLLYILSSLICSGEFFFLSQLGLSMLFLMNLALYKHLSSLRENEILRIVI